MYDSDTSRASLPYVYTPLRARSCERVTQFSRDEIISPAKYVGTAMGRAVRLRIASPAHWLR
jgi:hypothetical protein